VVSSRQVVSLITNHTFSNLVLRPPGVRAQGPSPDEAAYKALSDAMAANNGYASIPGYQLYDTTGTTEDWSYPATGGFGFTFEIGPDEFHPPYPEMIAEYEGAGQYAGKGNRGAYTLIAQHTIEAKNHSVFEGRAAPGTVLKLAKDFQSETSEVVLDTAGKTGPPVKFEDHLRSQMTVDSTGQFVWHVNPSTRPAVQKDRVLSGVNETPAETIDVSSQTPVPPGMPKLVEITVKPDAARQIRASISGTLPVDDYDIYLYEDSVKPENQVSSSASADATESITYGYPTPGKKYILEIVNYSAAGPITGQITTHGEAANSRQVIRATTEAYELTCERGGRVLRTLKVEIKRGQQTNLGDVCTATGAAPGKSSLRFDAAMDRRALRRGLTKGIRTRARCSERCTLQVRFLIDKATAKRYRLGNGKQAVIVAASAKRKFTGRTTVIVRFTKRARNALRKAKTLRLQLVATGVDAKGRKGGRSHVYRLRR
jgi:hypothetical protein